MKHVVTAVALATTLIVPAAAWAQNIAIVNGKPVPSTRLNALAQQLERAGRPVDDAAKAELKEEVIAREIFAQEAERRGLKTATEYRQQMELASQTLLIRELFADQQRKHPVTDADIQAEYDKFVAENGGKEFRARHILVEKEDEAKAILAALQQGEKFEDLAKQRSKDPGSGANGGDLDWASPDSFVPEFADAMRKLGKGQLTTAPVKSSFGWHIIRVDDVRDAKLPALADIKPQIQQNLQQQKLMDFQEKLRAKAKIQ
jgi:peptidyl-prolyl cis-trans isomerase C